MMTRDTFPSPRNCALWRKIAILWLWLGLSLEPSYVQSAFLEPVHLRQKHSGFCYHRTHEKRPQGLPRPSKRTRTHVSTERDQDLFIQAELENHQIETDIVQHRPPLRAINNDSISLASWNGAPSRNATFTEHYYDGGLQRIERQPKVPPRRRSRRITANPILSDSFPSYAVVYTNATVAADLDSIQTETNEGKSRIWMSHRKIWKRRNARSAEEGIRREKLPQLSSLLEKAKALDIQSPRYAARTIAGLVSALAEEVDDLDVEVIARPDTPFWDKTVDQVKITFSRLGFKPLKMGGLSEAMEEFQDHYPDSSETDFSKRMMDLSCADEAFKQIDVDNSGFLDRDEIGEALLLASGATDEGEDRRIIEELASDLLKLYDVNGDGVISRSEYQMMVEDMAALVQKQKQENEEGVDQSSNGNFVNGLMGTVKHFVGGILSRFNQSSPEKVADAGGDETQSPSLLESSEDKPMQEDLGVMDRVVVNSTESAEMIESMAKSLGSITLTDLKLDLRRLVFGAVPLIKRITPGGPLILEPFTVTVTGSFNRDDIMKSSLLEDGLSRLVAMVLRRRVRSLRDTVDLAVLFGRDYKLTSKNAPVTEVLELSNVEFDSKNRLIMTGRAKVRTRPGAPTIEQAFKVRAKLGTRKGGRFIRLVEPELAFVLECPKQLDESIALVCRKLNIEAPVRPQPLYSFFPVYSPFKPDDNDGFDLGEDNAISRIFIEDGALRFELSSVLRPGRFLGSHYIAFTLPFRTFIITLDRVKEGIRAARKAKSEKKRLAKLEKEQNEVGSPQSVDSESLRRKPVPKRKRNLRKSFFSRFVDGYMSAREEPDRFKISAIRDFFGRQSGNSTKG